MKQLNWAILGAGGIANELATAATRMGKTIYGIANRTHETAVKFAEKYGVTKVYDNIEDLFTDPNVDILYLSTPHNTHYDFIKKALLAGKHVLAEKSITLNSTQLEEVITLAKEKNLVLALKSMLGIAAKVRLVAPKSITRSEGKAVRVIDKRKLY